MNRLARHMIFNDCLFFDKLNSKVKALVDVYFDVFVCDYISREISFGFWAGRRMSEDRSLLKYNFNETFMPLHQAIGQKGDNQNKFSSKSYFNVPFWVCLILFFLSISCLSVPTKANDRFEINHSFPERNVMFTDKLNELGETLNSSDYTSSFWITKKNAVSNPNGILGNNINHSSAFFHTPHLLVPFGSPMELQINTLAPGASGLEISLPLRGKTAVSIDWGDGSMESVSASNLLTDIVHTYAIDGLYTIKLTGSLDQFGAGLTGYPNANKITQVISFGDLGITSFSGAFYDAVNLASVPSTTPAGVTDMSWMFSGAKMFNSAIGDWDVANVTTMEGMFKGASSFDQDLGSWEIISVENLSEFLSGISLSLSNYDSTLAGWSKLPLKPNVTFDGGKANYRLGVTAERRQTPQAGFSWKITDAGPIAPDSVVFNIPSTVILNEPFSLLASFFMNGAPYVFDYPVLVKKASGGSTLSGLLTASATGGKVFFQTLILDQLGDHTLELEISYLDGGVEKMKSFGITPTIAVYSNYLGGSGGGDDALISDLITVSGEVVYLWLGGALDGTQNWFNPANWSSNRVPGSTDYVMIPVRDYYPVITGIAPNNVIERQGSTILQERASITLESGVQFTISESADFITEGSTSKIILEPNSNYLNLSTSEPNLEIQQSLTGLKGWRMLGSPLKSKTYLELLDGLVPQGIAGVSSPFSALQPNVLWFDEQDGGTTLQSWRMPSNIGNPVQLGRGHFVYIFNGERIPGRSDNYSDLLPVTLKVEGKEYNFKNEGSFDFGITYTPRTLTFQKPDPDQELYIESNPADAGFNMISNPTASVINFYEESAWTKLNLDNTIYVWDPNLNSPAAGGWRTFNGTVGNLENGRLAPFQSLWVHANASSPSLTLNSNQAKSNLQKAFYSKLNFENMADANPNNQTLSLKVAGEGLLAEAWISFDENGVEGHDPKDAYQLESLSEDWLLLYSYGSQKVNTPLQINNLEPLDQTQKSIPLMMAAAKSTKEFTGNFKLSWNIPESWPKDITLVLMDHTKDRAIDMLKENYYQFDFKAPETITSRLSQLNSGFYQPGPVIFSSPFATGEPNARTGKANLERRPFTIRIGAFDPEQELEYLPDYPKLYSPYPNPFSKNFSAGFYIPYEMNVQFRLINSFGLVVRDFGLKSFKEGSYEFDFANMGDGLSSGLYFIQMVTEKIVLTKRIIKIG